ncbi:MAG: DUF7450 family protein [Actinomycetota bacterium]
MAMDRDRARLWVATALTLAATALVGPGTPVSAGQPIPAGYDLFETEPATTIANVQLPPGFFGPGSDPFNGDVNFGGEDLGVFNGHGVGDASTVVQRMEAADPAPSDTVPIEIVALSLVSVEPITVTYNGGQNPEDWDIRVGLSPSQPSQGHVNIERTGTNGGTFDSQLQVIPLFRFTRLSDGSTRTFDGAQLPPQGFELRAQDVPWRAGCVLPALAVPGLNDGFCPSFTPEGQKRLTVFVAPFVHHGVNVAQPASEHFKCYTLERARFKRQKVTLNDQFGSRQADVTKRKELCNPVQKNDEPYLNTPAHLVCYETKGTDPRKLVAVRNQFGSQRLLVREARRLCVPSEKHKGRKGQFKPIEVPVDHYQCYTVESETPLRRLGNIGTVRLKDQFGTEQVNVGKAVQLCAPVQKNNEQIQHPVNHLVCYEISDKPKRKLVEVRNQFEKKKLTTRKPVLLCVPSSKLVV